MASVPWYGFSCRFLTSMKASGPLEGATVNLEVSSNGVDYVPAFPAFQLTGADGLVSWATVPADTTWIRAEGSAGCGLDSANTTDWSSQINFFLAPG